MSSVRETVRGSRLTVVDFATRDGKTIWLRAFSGPTRADFRQHQKSLPDGEAISSTVVAAMGICERDGTLAYDWRKPEDLAELDGHFDADYLDEVALHIFQISGLGKNADADAGKK